MHWLKAKDAKLILMGEEKRNAKWAPHAIDELNS